jgi:quercetin dioxygenase-like cupin family protein
MKTGGTSVTTEKYAGPKELVNSINYQAGSVVSRTILKKATGNVTLFAFDAGEGLSEHTAPYDALVLVLEGRVRISVGGEKHALSAGEWIVMPARIPHALGADGRFKMLLTMMKS